MAVRAQARVVGEVEAVVVGIFVDYDLVGAPVPVVAEAVVSGENAEGEAAEPEAFAIATCDAPDVALAEAAGEATMFPGMIDVIAGIIAARVVAYPFIVGVNVRGVGVTLLVGVFLWRRSRAIFLLGRLSVLFGPGGRRAVSGNVTVADVFRLRSLLLLLAPFFLRESRNRAEQK